MSDVWRASHPGGVIVWVTYVYSVHQNHASKGWLIMEQIMDAPVAKNYLLATVSLVVLLVTVWLARPTAEGHRR